MGSAYLSEGTPQGIYVGVLHVWYPKEKHVTFQAHDLIRLQQFHRCYGEEEDGETGSEVSVESRRPSDLARNTIAMETVHTGKAENEDWLIIYKWTCVGALEQDT